MRLFILTLLGTVLLAGCGETDEAPVEEPESSETEDEDTAEDSEAAGEGEETESEEASNDDTDESAETENTASDNEEADEAEETESTDETEEEPADLMADAELMEDYWINYSGEDDARSHMTRTEPMPYNPEQDYTVTEASYVSYFYGNEFIKTNNYGHNGPHIIENVPEADRVTVSFSDSEEGAVELINEAAEEAKSGNEANTTPDELVGRGKPVEEEMAGTIMFGQEFLTGDEVFTGERIDDNGEFVEDEDYYVTGALAYNSSGDYVITAPAYVSFYNGRNFIETVEFTAVPAYLPQMNGTNYINISFHDEHLLDLNIIEVE